MIKIAATILDRVLCLFNHHNWYRLNKLRTFDFLCCSSCVNVKAAGLKDLEEIFAGWLYSNHPGVPFKFGVPLWRRK